MAQRKRIGIYNLNIQARGGGEKVTLVMAEHWSRDHDVLLIVPDSPDVSALQAYFDVDLSRVQIVALNEKRSLVQSAATSPRLPASGRAAFAHASAFAQMKALKLDVFVNNSYRSDLLCPAPRGIYNCMFPHQAPPSPSKAKAWARGRALGLHFAAPRAYDIIISLSHFTSEWVQKRWNRESELVYPVCDGVGETDASKEKRILNVGRFLPTKRQDALLDAFATMRDLHDDGWSLHFAGSTPTEPIAQRYLDELVARARDLPVEFHLNATLPALRELYRSAPIYWHAMGLGAPRDEQPELQEHFGITTVEAMSAGAVPVVYNTGGQREIVTHDQNGLLWDDVAALSAGTRALIADPKKRETLATAAIGRSHDFNRHAFAARMDEVLAKLCA